MTLEERVARLIDQSRASLSDETLAEALRYFGHDEFEMAFEGLVLELSAANSKPPGFDYEEWAGLVCDLGLRRESVFVNDFWSLFQKWAKSE